MREEILILENIEKTAKEILSEMKKGVKKNATILTLSGDLGAGKTTLTKELAKNLGIKENVISPTFVLMKIYKTKDKVFKNFIHIDAYRLEKQEEILRLGWEELVENKDNLIIIEWPEKVSKYLPDNTYNINLEHKDETTRSIKFWYN